MDSEEKQVDGWLKIIGFLVALMAIPVTGYVVFKLWNWFCVPLGIPAITWINALGIYLLFTFMCPRNKNKKLTGKECLTWSIEIWIKCGFFLLLGWIFKSLMIG